MLSKKRIAVLTLSVMMAAATVFSFSFGPTGRFSAFAAVASGGDASSSSTDDDDDDGDQIGSMSDGTEVTVLTYSDMTCIITGITSEETKITITPTVEVNGKSYKVYAIGQGAFDWCPNVTEIILPKTLTDVEEEAFDGPENLKSITFKSTGKLRFQEGSLTGTDNITQLRFTSQNVVVVVNKNAFAGVESTENIQIRTAKKMGAQLLNRVKSQFKKAGFAGSYIA